jgi:carboxymethylenebutenolidase
VDDKPENSPRPLEANQFPRPVLGLFDRYVHGQIDRRAFLEQAAVYATATMSAGAMLAALRPDFAHGQTIDAKDARIAISGIDIPSHQGSGTIRAYVAKPAGVAAGKRLPVILVAHENRGLNPHIEDIARRLAVAGYIAVAPDALTALGGYPGDEDKAREAFAKLDQTKIRADFLAAGQYAQAMDGGNGKLGVVGFCWGGGIANLLAARMPSLNAAVPFYGPPPPLDEVKAIKARLLIHYAGNDARVNAMWPDYEKALKAAKIPYRAYIYAGVEHGFNNTTTPRFDKSAADLAWARTMKLFNTSVRH